MIAKFVVDIETDKLHDPTVVHCVGLKDLETNEYFSFTTKQDYDRLREIFRHATLVVGHNCIDFDLLHLRRLLSIDVSDTSIVIDTLIMSRLYDYKLDNGHSLEAWGDRLGFPKLPFYEFDKLTEEMLRYMKRDVDLTHRLYLHLLECMKGFSRKALRVEHQLAWILRDMQEGGFPFDYFKMKRLKKKLEEEVEALDRIIKQAFPPKVVPLGEVHPKLTKFGTINRSNFRWFNGDDYSIFSADAPFTRIGWEEFNPGSTKQIVQRLVDTQVWNPVDRTDGYLDAIRTKNQAKEFKLQRYGWKINEQNLATLKENAPEAARKLVERLALGSRISTLTQWENAYSPPSGSIHCTFVGLGTWTHRMAHKNPNLANVAAEKSIKYKEPRLAKKVTELGARMRELWTDAGPGSWLVGTDAEGIQLRLFAHYIKDDRLIEAILNGNKDEGTDIHSMNRKALGVVCKDRDTAKTFIYAFLLGAGVLRISFILGCPIDKAEQAIKSFIQEYPGLAELRNEIIPKDVARGYFVGLDGRIVRCDSKHLMLAGYLQNGEACVMKHSMVLWLDEIKKLGIKIRPVNFVHDEWQTIVYGTREEADKVGQVQADCIRIIGEELQCYCPLAGKYVVGHNWHDTH